MVIDILGNPETQAYQLAAQTVQKTGNIINDGLYFKVDLAVAPLLTEKLTDRELNAPQFGTLIFHPSPLPYGRGASAIKHAYKRNEPITAATWFWADNGLDTGNICETEIIKIDYSLRPRQFYELHILPALVRTLERALTDISKGIIRRVPQINQYATFDYKA